MKILGAGMAGCLMGVLNPGAKIYEAASGLPDTHRAVLRFRDEKISKATGIPFKKVKVYKTIWADGKERLLGPQWINQYSKKVTGKYQPRSIVNLDTVERYIAPSNFHHQLADMCGDNIFFDHKLTAASRHALLFNDSQLFEVNRDGEPVISTIPMGIMADILGEKVGDVKFEHQPITVTRFKIKDCDVYQTVYYPKDNAAYRATLTGEDLIIESIGDICHNMVLDVLNSFGLRPIHLDDGVDENDIMGDVQSIQQYGKISPIDDRARRDFMLKLTLEHNIYSVGRFACWRNILLDDVYDDNFRIKAMINSDPYAVFKGARK